MSFAEVEANSVVISNDGETPCLKINNMRESAKFYDAESFNTNYADYMDEKISNNNLLTDSENHLQACNALNVLYVDVDYIMPDGIGDALDRNQELVIKFITRFIEVSQIDRSKIDNLFVFIPERLLETVDGLKAGGHCFLYMKENCTKPQRENIYSKARQLIPTPEFSQEMESLGCPDFAKDFEKIFDKGPFCTANTLLPFAEKKGAQRHYLLINPNDIDVAKPLLIPTIHKVVDEIDNDDEELEFDEDLDIDVDDTKLCSATAIETLKFIDSLKYLTPYHPLWDILKDHNRRLKEFIGPLIDWIIMCQFVGDYWNVEDGIKKIPIEVAKRTLPLVRMADPKKNLATLISDINRVCMLKYGEQAVGSWKSFFNKDLSESIICFKNKTNDAQIIKALVAHCKAMGVDAELAHELFKQCKKLLVLCITIWRKYCKMIHMIMAGMSEEIRPFRAHDRITLQSEIRDCSFDEITMVENNPDFRIYHKTIRRWLRMFICMMFYNKLDTNDAIRCAIGCLVRHFVFNVRNKGKADSDRPYIYNIRQNTELQAFPYNQWVIDTNAAMATSWFGSLYVDYVDEQLQTYEKPKFITPFINLLKTTQPVETIERSTDIQAPTNFKSDVKRIRNNILQMASNRHYNQRPIYQEVCGNSLLLPMRNGILEFIAEENIKRPDIVALGLKVGDFVFHYNNYGIYMDAYTNIPWHDEYNIHNPIYERVNAMFSEIYPDPAVCEYIKMMFAQTLHSKGSRDQIHQFYGQGAEGKSVINTAVAAMLGEKTGELTTRGYEDATLKNPYGLATTVEAEALLQANKSTHNSGGTAELVNKRFASVQEPETVSHGTNMNVSTGKRLTGDASLSTRKIYQEPIVFTPKLYITIQTNTLLGYSEDNDAVARRYAVIPHNAKFVSEAMLARTKKARFVHRADPSLSDNLRENPYYWEALFRVLLPYAQKFLKDKLSGLSDVKRPASMDALMDLSRANSSGLLGWFAKNFQEKKDCVLSVQYIVDFIFNADKQSNYSGEGSIFDAKDRNLPKSVKVKNIYALLTSRFGNLAMFKLRDRFIDQEGQLIPALMIDGEEYDIQGKMNIEEADHDTYFEEFAIQNLEMVNGGKPFDAKTIFIVGFDFIEEKKP